MNIQPHMSDAIPMNTASRRIAALGRAFAPSKSMERAMELYTHITCGNPNYSTIASVKMVEDKFQIIMHDLEGGYHIVNTDVSTLMADYNHICEHVHAIGMNNSIDKLIAHQLVRGKAFMYYLPKGNICFLNDGPGNILAIPFNNHRDAVLSLIGPIPQHTLLTPEETLLAEGKATVESGFVEPESSEGCDLKEVSVTNEDKYIPGLIKEKFDFLPLKSITRNGSQFQMKFINGDHITNMRARKETLLITLIHMFKHSNHHIGAMLRRMKKLENTDLSKSKLYIFKNKSKHKFGVVSLNDGHEAHSGFISGQTVRKYINYFQTHLPNQIVYLDI